MDFAFPFIITGYTWTYLEGEVTFESTYKERQNFEVDGSPLYLQLTVF